MRRKINGYYYKKLIFCLGVVKHQDFEALSINRLNMKKFVLAPYVRVGFLNGYLHFGFGSIRQLIDEKEIQNCILDAAVFLKNPYRIDEVESYLHRMGHNLEIIKSTIDVLLKKFIIPDDSYNREERHSRSFLFYSLSGAEIGNVQEDISNKTVAIVGCGGIGNVVGVLLATAGVKEFILVDSDQIELSNLSRQIMFREVDCNKYKTTVLSEALKERSSLINVSCK